MVTSDDWIRAASRRLSSRGVDAVRIEPIALDLGVSKGSFYWHFPHRDALLEAVLEHWRQAGVEAVVQQVEATTDDPGDRLRALLRQSFRHRDHGFDVAVRAWAAYDPRARAAARAIDAARTAYLVDLLVAAGARDPRRRAAVVYRVLLGEYATRHTGDQGLDDDAVDDRTGWALSGS
jgi:AcrR family transcriptional regulator